MLNKNPPQGFIKIPKEMQPTFVSLPDINYSFFIKYKVVKK
jgi:hypothetical protein